ncbi:MAG TPA: hypothetical protein VIT88_10680 [Pyrinomonadaceae bacterium]
MKRVLILLAVSLLLCSTANAFQGGGGESTKKGSSNKNEATKKRASGTKWDQIVAIAEPGFYITLFRPRAFAPRQPDAMFSFRGRGFFAFYGNPAYDKSYNNIEFVEKLAGIQPVMGSLFVGPFKTEAAAQRVVSEIPLILRKQIADDQRDLLRQSGSRLSPEETTGVYQVEVVRVLSDKVTGSFASLPPEDFVIRPGIGVGRVLIGNSRTDVLAVLGKPRGSDAGVDSWQDGFEHLTVSYRDGAVHQISFSSPKFHTTTGLTGVASSQVFLKEFPTRVKYCYEPVGASVAWEWTCWDAITKGIAMCKGVLLEGISNTRSQYELIVHRVNEALARDDVRKRCR